MSTATLSVKEAKARTTPATAPTELQVPPESDDV
jgi:hypothetical protein